MTVQPKIYTLSIKAEIMLRYLLSGHEVLADGRRYVMKTNPAGAFILGAVSDVMEYADGVEKKIGETVLVVNFTFTRFLAMVNSLTAGDYYRMEQVMEREGNQP